MTTTQLIADRFAPFSRENPVGFQTREFTVRAEPVGEGDARRLRLAISSEAPVERWSWDPELRESGGLYDEVLDHGPDGPDLSYVRDGIPICLDHNLRIQVGLGTTPELGDDAMLRTDAREGNHPEARWVFADMEGGIRQKVSVGYWPGTNYVQTKDERTGRITRRYKGWTLYEVSSVAVPADYAVGVGRSALGAARTEQAVDPANSTQETTMTVDTTSERGAAPAPDTRATELAVLARNFPTHARLAEWIGEGVSVDAARDEVMRKLQAAAEQRAPINGTQPASTTHNREEDRPWAEDGSDFFRAIVTASRAPEQMDPRLRAVRAQNTALGEEGGFAVPASVVNVMLEATVTGGEILSRVSTRPVTTGNSYTETVVKEEARTDGSRNGGVRGVWLAEDGTYTESQAATRQVELKVQKLGALVKLTEEQIEDGPALVSFLNEQVPEELRFQAERAVWEGDGTGKPLGLMGGGALITVAIEGTQTIANTNQFIWRNAAKMYSRLTTSLRRNAAWFINDELWANILTATAGSSAGAVPMFTPPGQMQQFPDGAIYGRPIVPIEYASAEGVVGDFVLASLSDYLLVSKGGIKQATSMHAEFVRDRQLMKFTWRVNGAPRTKAPVTPLKGSATKSPYVALAARS